MFASAGKRIAGKVHGLAAVAAFGDTVTMESQ